MKTMNKNPLKSLDLMMGLFYFDPAKKTENKSLYLPNLLVCNEYNQMLIILIRQLTNQSIISILFCTSKVTIILSGFEDVIICLRG